MIRAAHGATLLLLTAACSTAATTVSTSPRPAVEATAATGAPAAAPTAPAAALDEAPRDWQLLDAQADRVPGLGVWRAERELLAGRAPRRTVVVAVIDGGVDTAHVDLRANLWTNPREVAGNGRDDDGNGYVDDVHGWNFIGGRDGRDVNWDTLELTRLHARCTTGADARGRDSLTTAERTACPDIAATFTARQAELQQQSAQLVMIGGLFANTTRVLSAVLGPDSITVARVQALTPASDSVRSARQLYLRMAAAGVTPAALAEAKTDVTGRLEYGLNTAFDPRNIVGDDPRDMTERGYGNGNVTGPDAGHGSHVSGIIGAVRGNGTGIDGVATSVRIMMLRTVPNGDERDKDVANAIRYAADNGAHIINMSFGKDYSPGKAIVDEAVRYADSKGLLMVHAAGNDAKDLSSAESYPTADYLSGGRAANWIEVGASSWRGGDSLAATFTNYGRPRVDVFAPGVEILSTAPGNGYKKESGTSMATPVVSGLAALLMSHFPGLSAAQVKRLILETATPHGDTMVVRPGSQGEKVAFSTLSATGGVVNAYAAVKAALAIAGSVQ